MVLQQGSLIVSHENPEKNAEKDRHLDTGSFQNITYGRSQSYCRSNLIKFYLQKLTSRSQLYSAALPVNHLIRTFMDNPHNTHIKPIPHSINTLTNH